MYDRTIFETEDFKFSISNLRFALSTALVILNWVVIFILVVFVAIVFDPSGVTISSQDMDMDYDRFQAVINGGHKSDHQKIWERRCRFLLCSCFGGDEVHRHAFKDVGKLLACVFEDDMDLVPTDIAAGLIIINLMVQQR